MKIILASQSPSRKRLLAQAGFVFTSFAPNIDEELFLNHKKPENSCIEIARQKALKAQTLYEKEIIIACDQMVLHEGQLFGKAHTTKKAIETLIQLQGKTHYLLSGLCMLWGQKSFSRLIKSRLSMRHLSLKQIKNYVLSEKPLKSAGSYHIESKGIQLFEKIQTEDFYSIEGLPLISVIQQLSRWNYPLLDPPIK